MSSVLDPKNSLNKPPILEVRNLRTKGLWFWSYPTCWQNNQLVTQVAMRQVVMRRNQLISVPAGIRGRWQVRTEESRFPETWVSHYSLRKGRRRNVNYTSAQYNISKRIQNSHCIKLLALVIIIFPNSYPFWHPGCCPQLANTASKTEWVLINMNESVYDSILRTMIFQI